MDKLDGELKQRAARYKGVTAGEILSRHELHQVSRMLDPEVAAMVFYQSIVESRFDKEFVSLVNSTKLTSADKQFNRKTEIAFVPSTFANSGLKWGSEGEQILDSCRELGFTTETIETSPSSSMTDNALVISEYLGGCTAESVILISRNRGSAELRLLLQDRGPDATEFKKLTGWISITGILNGSIEHERVRNRKATSSLERLANWYFQMKSRLRAENQLALEQVLPSYSLWENDLKLPAKTSLVQLVGVARPRHLTGFKKLLAATLQQNVGPNDGVLFLEESWLRQGLRYPMWGLHSSSDFSTYRNVLERILLTMMQSQKAL